MNQKLKPCPFCGEPPEPARSVCCQMPAWECSDEQAAALWNTRPIEDALTAERDALRSALDRLSGKWEGKLMALETKRDALLAQAARDACEITELREHKKYMEQEACDDRRTLDAMEHDLQTEDRRTDELEARLVAMEDFAAQLAKIRRLRALASEHDTGDFSSELEQHTFEAEERRLIAEFVEWIAGAQEAPSGEVKPEHETNKQHAGGRRE
jgi:hypothetical protein